MGNIPDDKDDSLKRQAGILGQALRFDDKKVKSLVNASYKLGNGYVTFSDNVWHNTEMLKARLVDVLNSAILQGKNPNQYISKFDAQPYQIGRLLITETARVQGDVQLDSYKQGGIEWYDISFESSACRICQRAASGGPYRHDRAVVGYNMYPFHPNCLCSIMPAEKQNDFAALTRKKLSKKRKVINRERQRKLTEDFRRRGGIIQQDEAGEAYLASRGGAAGITLDEGTIVLHIRPTISEILEELYHAEQFRRNEIDGTEINRYRAEIKAQYYLLSVEKLYDIPKEETKQTKDNLNYWKEKLKEALKDES
ncbi:minor capsid protein [Ligilactobacillus murinus]|uniref:minor capsid protein n=1 Tax=Ligilactobacillus murinus TaxID=1622 RepID=UPI00096ED0CB|nr:minor capsid protein [Ligilactobacillus murinus]